MKLKTLIQVLITALITSNGLFATCSGCPRGEAFGGLAGSGGGGGFGGAFVLDHLYNFNTTPVPLVLISGSAIPFNGTPVIGGTAISQSTLTTFLITETGHYYTNFTANVSAVAVGGGVTFFLNGVPQGVTSLASAGAPLVLQQILNVTTVPSTLQVVVTCATAPICVGASITLLSGTSANISIIQLSTP